MSTESLTYENEETIETTVEETSVDTDIQEKPKKPKKKKMFTPEYYQCIADGEDSFFAVVESMRKICKPFNSFVTPIYNEIADETGYYNVDSLFEGMSKATIENHSPKLLSNKNTRTSLTLTVNKIRVKIGSVAYGFEIAYHVENSQAYVDTCTGTVVLYSNNAELRNSIMRDNNWERVFKDK